MHVIQKLTRPFNLLTASAAVAILFVAGLDTASAQSGTKAMPRASTPPASTMGSSSKVTQSPVGLQGYCPVCIVEMKKWVKGNAQFAAQQDGQTYLFPGGDQRQMFLKQPSKYTPVLGGDCVVSLVEMGKRTPGSLQFSALHKGRLFLFANEQGKNMFRANATKYANADLAMGGKCAVCRVEMNRDVDGLQDFTTIYQGMRYLFPGREQQAMFAKNPGKYAVGSQTLGSGTR